MLEQWIGALPLGPLRTIILNSNQVCLQSPNPRCFWEPHLAYSKNKINSNRILTMPHAAQHLVDSVGWWSSVRAACATWSPMRTSAWRTTRVMVSPGSRACQCIAAPWSKSTTLRHFSVQEAVKLQKSKLSGQAQRPAQLPHPKIICTGAHRLQKKLSNRNRLLHQPISKWATSTICKRLTHKTMMNSLSH